MEYHVIDAEDRPALRSLGQELFDKAVCTMALMDMHQIAPLSGAAVYLLKPHGAFVFSVTHPCFHTSDVQRYAEAWEEQPGGQSLRTGVKVHG